MEKLWMALPGAALAGLGAVLCATGGRELRRPSKPVVVGVFAGAGAAAGSIMGFPAFAAGLCVVAATLAHAYHAVLGRVTVGLTAAIGGGALGLLLSVIFGTLHPAALCFTAAAGAAIVSLLEHRVLTIAWTSAAGAALIAHGLLRATPELVHVPRGQLAWTLAALFAALCGAGVSFQMRSTAEPQVPATIVTIEHGSG
jgi:hypothetical protein